jgi:hypothetical protein
LGAGRRMGRQDRGFETRARHPPMDVFLKAQLGLSWTEQFSALSGPAFQATELSHSLLNS